ncbi:MAG TPA: hypothetical protein PLA71_01315 [Saccharofermentans sp.]|nr:hypothetical protein [Saccharofermentans sp.]
MGEYIEAHKDMVKQMKRYKPSRDELNSVYFGAISLYLASIADSLDKIAGKEKTCEEGRQRPETDISNSCTS